MKNKLRKRVTALLCAVTLIVTLGPGYYAHAEDAAEPSISVSSATAQPGQTFIITVSAENFSEMTALQLMLVASTPNAVAFIETSKKSTKQ